MPPQPFLQNTHYLRWRGRQEGPLTLEAIRARLTDGQIGLLHEIQVQGHWLILGDYLDSIARQQREEEAARDQRARQAQEQSDARQRAALEDARQQNESLRRELDQAFQPPTRSSSTTPSMISPPATHYTTAPTQGVSGLAITAFVMAILNFVPVINFVSWILAIIFGHIALSNLKRTPGLGGKGLATAALGITYGLLALGFLYGLILVAGAARTHRF